MNGWACLARADAYRIGNKEEFQTRGMKVLNTLRGTIENKER